MSDFDKKLVDKFSNITAHAAASCYIHLGKNDKILADKAATDSMRNNLNTLDVNGKIVIGEGELDEAPMLYIGEELGTKTGPKVDIAVDPLEGTNFAAKNLPGALSVMAIALEGNLFHAPETYMNKLAVTNDIPNDVTDLDYPVKKNIQNIADFKNNRPEDITVCLLDRPRHKEIIDELRKLKVNLKLISDGDVTGALLVTEKKHSVDLFLGIGGGPEGVLAACALDAYGCKFQGRFLFKNENDISRAKKMGIKDLNKKYEINEIVKGDSVFCASGITNNDLVNGVKKENDYYSVETLVTHKSTGINIVKKRFQLLD